MAHKAVTYSFIGCDDTLDPANPHRRLAFVPAAEDAAERLKDEGWDVLIHETLAATHPRFAKRYWYVQYVEEPPTVIATVLSTAHILLHLERRRTLFVISGPFKAESEALYDLDVRWESYE
jgi:hypothetical protein